jgi:RimJ/RimL family protein N-acetyltransferase
MKHLETPRLDLRPLTVRDVDLLLELDSDPEVMRFISGGKPSSRKEVEATVQDSLGARWIAFRKDTDAFIGWFGLNPSGDTERELGYRLRRDAWRQGFATEGAREIVRHAFADLGVTRIWAQTMTANAGSRGVMERVGLRYSHTFFLEWDEPIAGAEFGDVEYELLSADWLEPQSSS